MPTAAVNSVTLARAVRLLSDPPAQPDIRNGYLDLLPSAKDVGTGRIQAMWQSWGGSGAYDGLLRLGAAAQERLPALGWGSFFDVPARLGLTGGQQVLDIGSGPGHLTRRIARAVGEDGLVLGLDASTAMLRRAARAGGASSLLYVRGDATRLPLADGSMDAVASSLCLQLLPDPFGTLDEIHRVLKPGGTLALTVPGPSHGIFRPLSELVDRLGQVRLFKPGELVASVRERGFAGVVDRSGGTLQLVDARKPG